MALTNFGLFQVPLDLYTSISVGQITLDATGEKMGMVFEVPVTGTLNGFTFRLGTVTTGQTLRGTFQDVDPTTGFPDETEDQSGTVAVASADDNTFKTITMGAGRSVTKGDVVAAVIQFDSTIGNLIIFGNASIPNFQTYNANKIGAGPTWAKLTGSSPILAVEYSGGVYHPIVGATPANPGSRSINTGSNPDEVALHFTLPAPIRCVGLGGLFTVPAGADWEMILYDTDGNTVLGTTGTQDGNVVAGTGSNRQSALFTGSPVSLSAGVAYRAALKPLTATNNVLGIQTVHTAAAMDQLPFGQTFQTSTRNNGGSWTEVATERPHIYLLADQIHDGSGSSGGGIRLAGGGGLAA
jgi:hypothetical protein